MNDNMFVDEDKEENPYGSNYYQPQRGPHGKKLGVGFGIAALVLGIIALLFFFTFVNLLFAILAIIFGIIQIAAYERKGAAIGGIVTAALSILLFVVCYGMLLSNPLFIQMVEEEILGDDGSFEQYLEEYEQSYGDGDGSTWEFDDGEFDDGDLYLDNDCDSQYNFL